MRPAAAKGHRRASRWPRRIAQEKQRQPIVRASLKIACDVHGQATNLMALMDLNELKRLVELMESAKLVELEYDEQGKHVRLRRAEERSSAPPAPTIMPLVTHALPPVAAPAAPAPAPAPAPAASKRPDNIVGFKSPLVGTFYRAARPDADAFANVGDEVNGEKVICIIEAMKVMNEIKAEMHGVIREILVKNSQAVEFGEVLFLIEKK